MSFPAQTTGSVTLNPTTTPSMNVWEENSSISTK